MKHCVRVKKMFAPCFCVVVCALSAVTAGAEQVVVQLKDVAPVTQRTVTLKDVAVIFCTDAARQAVLEAIEVAALQETDETFTIDSQSVLIRLVLNGQPPDDFRMEGAAKSVVEFREPHVMSDSDIETAAADMIHKVLGIPGEDLQVRLSAPLMQLMPKDLRTDDGLRVEVLPPLRYGLGTTTLTVRIWKGDLLISARSARFEILKRQHVAVARVSLRRGQAIDKSVVQFERRFLAGESDELPEEMIIGRKMRTDRNAGEILSMRDLDAASTEIRPVLIHRRDNVRVTSVSGSVQVTLLKAEALQEGRVGDLIQVRNTETGRIISGRVKTAGHVEVRLR